MKYKMVFEPEMSNTVKTILKNEKEQFRIKFNKSRTMRIRGWLARRKYGIEMNPIFEYTIYDNYAEVEIETGLDWLADKKRIFAALKRYEEISNGKIIVEVIEDE